MTPAPMTHRRKVVNQRAKLSASMTVNQFENGYWYATELKDFAEALGIPLVKGVKLTYGDLVKEYVRLNQTEGPFTHIPHGRYINFVSDFLAAEKTATREQAIRAWHELKALNVPKNYRAWARVRLKP